MDVAALRPTANATRALGNDEALAVINAPVAPHVVRASGIQAGQRVLDVGHGTSAVAVTNARAGAIAVATGIRPLLLERAKESAKIGGLPHSVREASSEDLPFRDREFDAVLSTLPAVLRTISQTVNVLCAVA